MGPEWSSSGGRWFRVIRMSDCLVANSDSCSSRSRPLDDFETRKGLAARLEIWPESLVYEAAFRQCG